MKRVLPVLLVAITGVLLAVLAWFAGQSPAQEVSVGSPTIDVSGDASIEPITTAQANRAEAQSPPVEWAAHSPAPAATNTPDPQRLPQPQPDVPVPAGPEGPSIRVRVYDPFSRAVLPEKLKAVVRQTASGERVWYGKLRSRDMTDPEAIEISYPKELLGNEGVHLEVYVAVIDYAPTRVVVPFPTNDVEVRLATPAFLILDVPNADGYRDSRVTWWLRNEWDRFSTDRDSPVREHEGGGGVYLSPYRSELVTPGHYTLEIARMQSRRGGDMPDLNGWGVLVLERYEMDLKPGRNDFSVRLPDLFKVTVKVGIRKSGELRLYSRDRNVELPATDTEDGREFKYVPPGDWVLYDYLGRQAVHVDGDTEVDFEPTDADCFKITDAEPGHPMAEAGFQPGDLVIETYGLDLAGMRNGEGKRPEDPSSVTWTALRGGERVSITFNERATMKAVEKQNLPPPYVPWRRDGWPEELRLPEIAYSR